MFSFRLFLFFSCFFLTLELLVFSVKDFIFAEFTFQWPVEQRNLLAGFQTNLVETLFPVGENPCLVTYGSEQALGTMVALSLVRELGPAVTALLFAGRAGTALTAEIGLMRAGEQLAAMEMMGVDPVRRVLAPRFIGAFVAMPVLATIFSAVGIMGAWFVGVEMIGTDGGAFWSQMQSAVDVWHDIGNGFIKSVVFGVAVALVALFNGYAARPTPEGVSRATTSTVVVASLLVLGLDFIMTAWMFTTV